MQELRRVRCRINKDCHFLWLEGVFNDKTLHAFKSISAASNFWQKGFLEALRGSGVRVDVVGYAAERVWPFGRLMVHKRQAELLLGFDGTAVCYINLPAVRGAVQYFNLFNAVLSRLQDPGGRPDYAVVFSCLERANEETPAIRVARHIRERYGIPWICIVADGVTPPGADRYVFLSWFSFQSAEPSVESIHLDGGVADVRCDIELASKGQKRWGTKILMYMGALTEHGGVTQLARAFMCLEEQDVELWICGRGSNPELDRLASENHRIRLKGFVGAEELDRLAKSVFAFVNPRPNSFVPNKLNYPSKLLHYFAYGKPVVSTFTEGMSPEYSNVLVRVEDESEVALATAMRSVLTMSPDAYDDVCRRVERFNGTHTWEYQINRFMTWLEH